MPMYLDEEREVSATPSANAFSELEVDRVLLERASTAERVARVLRTKIMEGLFAPGSRLPEELIASMLAVSRNTIREAFRLLCYERLAVHEPNRGVFVSDPTTEDLIDLYRIRRMMEGAAARAITRSTSVSLHAVNLAVHDGRAAAKAGQWQDAGTADLNFHQALVSLAKSPRMDELMKRVLAELRLIFHVMDDPERFHAPYLERNSYILELLDAGDGLAAEQELLSYLDDAERQLLQAYEERLQMKERKHIRDQAP